MTSAARDYSQMFAADGTVLRHPDRVKPRYRPLRAWKNFRLLIADKEDTSLVFKIFESLPSKTFLPRVAELALSDHGETLRRTEPRLPEILDDHAALRRTPKGSLAHAYCDFMEAEGFECGGSGGRGGEPRAAQISRALSNGSWSVRATRMICFTF